MKKILVTGAAGFIGHQLVIKLLENNYEVVGLDNLNDYYDISLKYGRLQDSGIINKDENVFELNNFPESKIVKSKIYEKYKFIKDDLQNYDSLDRIFSEEKFDSVCNLAAQAGVRYSIQNPRIYIQSNVNGFFNILELCRHHNIKSLSYASSSSVYGLNKSQPYSTDSVTDHPISLYAASKKSNEVMAHSYSHLYGISTTGIRFFTVYGPWGRPDMALFLFTKSIIEGKPINVFNNGEMYRDFTYIDDIVNGVLKIIENPATPSNNWNGNNPHTSTSSAPYRIYNIGHNGPVKLLDFVKILEQKIGKEAIINYMPIQAGDVQSTHACVDSLIEDFDYKPKISINEGIDHFVNWYLNFYKINIK